MKLINKTEHGQLSFCKCCDAYQLEFGNILFSFSQKDLPGLKEYIRGIDAESYARKNAHLSFQRKIMLQFPVKNILFCLHSEELEELKELLFIKKKKVHDCHKQLTDNTIFPN